MARFEVNFMTPPASMAPYCRIFCNTNCQDQVWNLVSQLFTAFGKKVPEGSREGFFKGQDVPIVFGLIEARFSSNGFNRDKIHIQVDYSHLSNAERHFLGEKIEQLAK